MTTDRYPFTRRTFLKGLSTVLVADSLSALTGCAPRATVIPATLTIIPRAGWEAVEPDLNAPNEHGLYDPVTNPGGWEVYAKPLSQVLNTIVIHHSALPLSDGPREIQDLHMRAKGYADIGYHFVADAAGQVYEGRAITTRGAHTGGHNTGTVGVVLTGNFEDIHPTEAQVAVVKLLIRYLIHTYAGISHLAGHHDFQPEETVCPGKNLEPLLPGWATELGLKFGTGGYVGA